MGNILEISSLADSITIIIGVGLAIAAILSPVVVALINNRHQYKQRQIELSHDEIMKELDIKQEVTKKHMEFMLQTKQKAFNDLLDAFALYFFGTKDDSFLPKVYSSAYKAFSICSNDDCRREISELISRMTYIYEDLGTSDIHIRIEMLSEKLHNDLLEEIKLTETAKTMSTK